MTGRTLFQPITTDLASKMVFIAGPRQAGKTTMAKAIANTFQASDYFSWDDPSDRKKIKRAIWPSDPHLLIFDEIHKWRGWKRWIKGQFDKYRQQHHFLVTGSARMDVYRRGGDSLQGRYHHYRLHPFTLSEMLNSIPIIKILGELQFLEKKGGTNEYKALKTLSGFPEPLFSGSERTYRRWQKERVERFVREDIRDLETVRDLASLESLLDLLPARASQLLSLQSLREDLEVSHKALSHWVDVLETLYFLYRIYPYHSSKVTALKKMPKLYFWDWTLASNPGACLENLVASHLLKTCHYLEDVEGYDVKLHYLRDKEKREVDFLVCHKKKPWFAVEVKTADTGPSSSLLYYKKYLSIPYAYQVIENTNQDITTSEGIRIMPVQKFLSGFY